MVCICDSHHVFGVFSRSLSDRQRGAGAGGGAGASSSRPHHEDPWSTRMIEELQSASRQGLASAWPYYSAAARGLRNYWYPVMLSRRLGKKPVGIMLCGEKIVLTRHAGRAYGLHNRCPHRGVPLSEGAQQFPGLLTCAYHGWTYDLGTGQLEAVLTDGPDSPICGKASVRVSSYPVEERAGLVWVYVGDEAAPPVEADIPSGLLEPGLVVEGVFQLRRGNWRYAAENGID